MKAVEDYLEQQLLEKPQFQEQLLKLSDYYQKRFKNHFFIFFSLFTKASVSVSHSNFVCFEFDFL
jgi:hypothetical protein